MRTINIVKLFSFLLLAGGCVSEDVFEIKNGINSACSLSATIENSNFSETRTAIDEKGNTLWVSTDRLGVFGDKGAKNKEFVYDENVSNVENVTFTGYLSEDPTERIKWAYYPYHEDVKTEYSADGTTSFQFMIPSAFKYTGESRVPMLATQVQQGKFVFKYLGGVLKITLGNMPADANSFLITSLSGKEGEEAPAIAGTAVVTDISINDAAYAISSSESRTITYDIGQLDTGVGYHSFFIPIPVGIYPKLEVKLVKNDGTIYFTRTLSNRQFERAKMIEMPILDAQTGECYILNEHTQEITSDLDGKISISLQSPSILIYSGVSKDELPEIGNILLKKDITEDFPQGFLGRVVSITENEDGIYMVATEGVSLDEAFKALYVNETVDILPANTRNKGFAKDEDGYYCFDLKMEANDEGGIHYGSGTLTLGLKFTPYVDISENNHMMSFVLQSKVSYSGEFGFKGEFEHNVIEKALGGGFWLPPFNAGPLVITPHIQPYFVIQPSGKLELSTRMTFSTQHIAAAEYKGNQWSKNSRSLQTGKKPWDIEGKFQLSGSLFLGTCASLEARLYNLDFLNASLKAKCGYKLSGDIDLLSLVSATDKEELLNSCSAKHQLLLGGEFSMEAKLLTAQQKVSFKFPELVVLEKDLWVIPQVEKPKTTLVKHENFDGNYSAIVIW